MTRLELIQSFYSIPAVKYYGRALSHLAWLLTYTLLLGLADTHSQAIGETTEGIEAITQDNFHWNSYEIIWVVFQLAFFLDQQVTRMHHRDLNGLANTGGRLSERILVTLCNVIFITSFILRQISRSVAATSYSNAVRVRPPERYLHVARHRPLSLSW